ncbi:hypothetical protein WQQ_24400 [Hydrocarboniphaga effusa AP103]|uniref:Uncharacterized protein n=1 Tax=Hydrocarboniphaga effusa AP103 TaxID=1172194 RepID=I8T546_9GAMM|nr:hypothetical protein WQQ_24400 [Hydrocarboniphaga effusa AP103]
MPVVRPLCAGVGWLDHGRDPTQRGETTNDEARARRASSHQKRKRHRKRWRLASNKTFAPCYGAAVSLT